MSLHAQLTPGAVKKLQESRRNSSIAAILIALLGCVLLALVLAVVLLKGVSKDINPLVNFRVDKPAEIDPQQHTREFSQVERPPSAPSNISPKFLNSLTSSTFAVKSPDVPTTTSSLELGTGNDFGNGIDLGDGDNGGKPVGNFGSPEALSGTLPGYLYDFKQTSRGRTIEDYSTSNRSHFTDRVNDIQNSRFSESSLRKHFRAPQKLHVRYIAIPFSDASNGPKFFNAENVVKPSGWIVHYSGKLKAPTDGEYRLVGSGDDYMSVAIDRKMRLVAAWTDIAESVAVRGANAEQQPNHKGPFGTPLTYGSWFTLRAGQTIDVDIALGERPGGKVGFVLMLEKKGENYREAANGRKILPPFVFGQLAPADLDYFENFPEWKWDTDHIQMFSAANER